MPDSAIRQGLSPMRRLLLFAIRVYQRQLSPHKGFVCAYRLHTGRASCSALGYRAVRRHGVIAGIALIRARTRLCGVAHRRHCVHSRAPLSQRGSCDVGCDLPCDGGLDLPGGCDFPSGHSLPGLCDILSCCDFSGCDWPNGRRGGKEDKYVYIPPNADLGRPRGSRQGEDAGMLLAGIRW